MAHPITNVRTVLADMGPMTLQAISRLTGHTQDRLRTHLRSNRDAYDNAVVIQQGVKLRIWYVKGALE